MPTDRAVWPPDILFDAAYGAAVLHHFGATGCKDLLSAWENIYYPEGKQTSLQREQKKKEDAAAKRRANIGYEDNEFTLDWNDPMDRMLFMLPYPTQASWERAQVERKEARRRELCNRVSAWSAGVG